MSDIKSKDIKKIIKDLSKQQEPEGDVEGVPANNENYLAVVSDEEKEKILNAHSAILNYVTTSEGKPNKRSLNTLNKMPNVKISMGPSQYGEQGTHQGLITIERNQTKDDEGFATEPITLTLETNEI